MNTKERTYVAIDLKSFYASAECVDMGLNPLTTNLVVADKSRTDKTICLAVSPSLKAYGISGRARLFEVVQRVKEVNDERRKQWGQRFTGTSTDDVELRQHPELELDYVVTPPRMARYIEVSVNVYKTYLKYIAPEDIHVYSIDEVFMDLTDYVRLYKKTAHELTMMMVRDVFATTGVTATAGIGTNLYLAKVAMDIVAKHIPADKDGVRIAELDEQTYRRQLWDHYPLTDFWRVGHGIAEKLSLYGLDTMGKIARQSVRNENIFYQLFGVNAELLIDHAWGWEPCTMDAIKAYRPESRSFSSGQVLQNAYDARKARIVVREMAEAMALDLVAKRMVTNQLVLTVSYDKESLKVTNHAKYRGEVKRDYYGRIVPKHAHGTANLGQHTSSTRRIAEAVMTLYDKIVNTDLLVRRLNLTTNNVVDEDSICWDDYPLQLDLFIDHAEVVKKRREEKKSYDMERRIQEAQLSIKRRYGKNSILKGLNFEDGATGKSRNAQIGGHKA